MDRRLELIAEMTPAIWIHLMAALLALVLGALVLFRRKGDARHRLWGRIWVGAMALAALSSFRITEIRDGFSPIHALSVYTLISLTLGVRAIRRPKRDARAIHIHAANMRGLYAAGMPIAGGFTFLPDRLLGRLTFGETLPAINYAFVGLCAVAGVYLALRFARPPTGHPLPD